MLHDDILVLIWSRAQHVHMLLRFWGMRLFSHFIGSHTLTSGMARAGGVHVGSIHPSKTWILVPLITYSIPWLTSAICDRYLLFLPCTKINIAQAKPEGRYAHARMLPLFRQPFFSLGLVPLCSLVFSLFLLFNRVLLSACLLMLTFPSKGKAYWKCLGGKATSLCGEIPACTDWASVYTLPMEVRTGTPAVVQGSSLWHTRWTAQPSHSYIRSALLSARKNSQNATHSDIALQAWC